MKPILFPTTLLFPLALTLPTTTTADTNDPVARQPAAEQQEPSNTDNIPANTEQQGQEKQKEPDSQGTMARLLPMMPGGGMMPGMMPGGGMMPGMMPGGGMMP
ncbi:hypothetical protein C7999DRAFT_34114, partial [Corynascus novoguineensis]